MSCDDLNPVIRSIKGTPKVRQLFETRAAAKAFITEYVANYHPLGYGTECYLDEHSDGTCTAWCYRADSCE